jgi:hypothetical protein
LRIVPPQLYTDDVCDWWKLRPKLGQVCDIGVTPHHREHPQVVPGLGAYHDVRPERDLNKKLRHALGWKRLKANAAIEPTRMLHSQSAL